MKRKPLLGILCILCTIIVGCNQQIPYQPSYEELHCDETILANLLDFWGEELDACYNSADLTECPWEKYNWLNGVACEMDWQHLAGYIIAMPQYGTDEDVYIMDIIIDGRHDEIIPLNK